MRQTHTDTQTDRQTDRQTDTTTGRSVHVDHKRVFIGVTMTNENQANFSLAIHEFCSVNENQTSFSLFDPRGLRAEK